MSEQGWHGFLAAEGVEDWVVLHGGATAVFRVGSLAEASVKFPALPLITEPNQSLAVEPVESPMRPT